MLSAKACYPVCLFVPLFQVSFCVIYAACTNTQPIFRIAYTVWQMNKLRLMQMNRDLASKFGFSTILDALPFRNIFVFFLPENLPATLIMLFLCICFWYAFHGFSLFYTFSSLDYREIYTHGQPSHFNRDLLISRFHPSYAITYRYPTSDWLILPSLSTPDALYLKVSCNSCFGEYQLLGRLMEVLNQLWLPAICQPISEKPCSIWTKVFTLSYGCLVSFVFLTKLTSIIAPSLWWRKVFCQIVGC